MDKLHKNVKAGFIDPELYEKNRPSYTDQSVAHIAKTLSNVTGIGNDVKYDILELGTGTGKFTRKLLTVLPQSTRYLATEPMTEFLTALREECPNLKTEQCTADNIPLPDNSVKAVIAAQSFHWFFDQESLKEIWRVLVPRGRLVLIWNAKDPRRGWMKQCEDIKNKYCDDHSVYGAFKWREKLNEFGGFRQIEHLYLPGVTFKGPKDLIIGRFASSSWISSLPEGEKKKALDSIKNVLDTDSETRDADTIVMPMVTDLYYYGKC